MDAISVNLLRKAEILQTLSEELNLNVPPMTEISMDIKEMAPNYGYTGILVLLLEVSNWSFIEKTSVKQSMKHKCVHIFRCPFCT